MHKVSRDMTVLQPLLIGDGANFVHVVPPPVFDFQSVAERDTLLPFASRAFFPKGECPTFACCLQSDDRRKYC